MAPRQLSKNSGTTATSPVAQPFLAVLLDVMLKDTANA
jgi:hypothetical protein